MVYRQAVKALCCAALLACSLKSADQPDPLQVLERATIKVRVRSATLPNYTCVETVKRDYYQPKKLARGRSCASLMGELQNTRDDNLRLTVTDRLRLDVTMTDRGEIYSWAGASKFEDADISQLVHRGPIGTGSFGAMLSLIFGQSPNRFHFEGMAGRLVEYSFHVAQEDSRYKVRTTDSWVYTAYSGTVQVDPETAEVVRLSVATAELPPSTGSCQTASTMEFSPIQIDNREVLLATQVRQRFVDINGEEVENTTTFASCREYRGESTVTFLDGNAPDPTRNDGGPSAPLAGIPAGLPFTFELTTPIAAATAAGGDAFAGRLVGALRDRNGKLIAPAHAVIEGRLLRVENHHTAPVSATLVLRLRTIQIGGLPVPLIADRDWSRGRLQKGSSLQLPSSWEQHAALVQLAGAHPVLKAGTRFDWVTR